MYHRKGMSSILGTLIFIGIMFSAVIPMFIQMRQADVYYEHQKLDVSQLDEDRELEDLEIYVSPDTNDYTLTVVNTGEVPVTLVRIWENHHNTSIRQVLTTQSSEELDAINFAQSPAENQTFEIRVTTERGNSFLNENGVMTYGSSGWMLDKFFIRIHAGGLFLHVKVYNSSSGDVYFDEWDTVGAGYQVEVPQGGTYCVLVEEKFLWWTTVLIDHVDYTIVWPPNTSIDVYP